jgi:hypothetical protein
MLMHGNRQVSPTSGRRSLGTSINREAIGTTGRHAGGFTAWRADNRVIRGHTVRGGEASAFFSMAANAISTSYLSVYACAAARSIDAPEHDQTMARKGFFCGAVSLSAQQTAIVLNKRHA